MGLATRTSTVSERLQLKQRYAACHRRYLETNEEHALRLAQEEAKALREEVAEPRNRVADIERHPEAL